MTVAQLIEKLKDLPSEAVVLLEIEAGLARVAGLDFEKSAAAGLPDEVILFTDAEE